ncbi:hypothetical protein ACQKL6_06370 [Peribacillus sp. NPDC097197]|uniref:hypothetical protein n=1 Tax=Peribacillus sp. NPDC097197 TaxID=3390615 RepID=UPI003D06FF2A
MEKFKKGIILGALSIVPVVISIMIFFATSGPNANPVPKVYFIITLSIIGIILAGTSIRLTKQNAMRLLIGGIGVIANLFILVCILLLLFAFGMGEA